MKYLYKVLKVLFGASAIISFLLFLFFRGRAMEDDEDYGDVDIGTSGISVPDEEVEDESSDSGRPQSSGDAEGEHDNRV